MEMCANCDGLIGSEDTGHLVECFDTIGELYCAECWEEMIEANAAYGLEDSR